MFNDFARRLIRTTNAIVDQFVNDISVMVGIRRCARVATVDYVDAAIFSGDYYVAFLLRTGVTANSTYNWLIAAPLTHDILIDLISPAFDFAALTTGSLSYKTEVFYQESSGNDYSYSGGSAAASLGRSMNGYNINEPSAMTVSAGGSATPTGTADFVVVYETFLVDTQSSSKSLIKSDSHFFDGSRKLLMKAGTTALVRATTVGTAGGTFSVDSTVAFYERAVA